MSPSLSGLKSLWILSLFGNHFTGNIPTEFAEIGTLRKLNLSTNALSGQIPNTSFSAPVFASGTIGGGGCFDDELPLFEELGINTRQIWRKTVSILNPLRVNPDLHEDAHLSGPFIFLMAFGLFQLLAGKLHFGIILGWVTVAALFLFVVFNMLAGRNWNLDLYRCLSLVGYCMLPMVIFSAIALFAPQGGVAMFGMGAIFVFRSTWVCTRLLVELAHCGEEHRGLIAYACSLSFCLKSEQWKLRSVERFEEKKGKI